ncbi:unnamed protein product [Peronospora belbahrii]|uniref:Cation-transporting P-type ATPase C-terminal domain-containing protein n=1 Tax=Peronospora belbahrii TaxID=622444 RepID=A0ABN8D7H0_9STRA|nr:unnamed protein product [Peronospora belbahrii]
MQQLSTPASVPDDYKSVADRLAKEGCYVLGLSYRKLPSNWTQEQVVEFANNREAVDESLSLLGLILFRNELKEDTVDAIAKLKGGDIRMVMVTGDNAMCGCYIARQSGMLSSASRLILGEMVSTTKHLVEQVEDVELAVTGSAFDYLVARGEIKELLLNIRIFSRMTPDGKVECVKLHMETGAVTGMCGDGGNDCGALRFAHAGVALSDAEASVVSPFTSREKSIQSVVDLCREGRCSVATSFASVKFLIMYGLIGSVLRLFMYFHAINLSQWCWILVEGFMLVGCSYVITLSKPLDELKPFRPTSSLIGPTTLASILGQEAINVIYMSCCIHMLSSQVCNMLQHGFSAWGHKVERPQADSGDFSYLYPVALSARKQASRYGIRWRKTCCVHTRRVYVVNQLRQVMSFGAAEGRIGKSKNFCGGILARSRRQTSTYGYLAWRFRAIRALLETRLRTFLGRTETRQDLVLLCFQLRASCGVS